MAAYFEGGATDCSLVALVAFVMLGWLLPEIKGKSLEELEVLLQGKP